MTTSFSTPRHRPSLKNLSYSVGPSSVNPNMPRRAAETDIDVGDVVEVPGGMDGTVKFVGEVRGKQGYFVGVELSRKWASRGKNDGDADGVHYFSTAIQGAGIFLPINRAVKRSSPVGSTGSIPMTPPFDTFSLNVSERTPPSMAPKFSQSVSSARAPSPAFRPKSRPSLPRPESPLRRAQAAPLASTPAPRPSLNMLSQNRLAGPRYAASPTPAKVVKGPSKHGTFTSPATIRSNARPISKDGDDEVTQLRAMLQEKNERIAMLTTEFDSHRADFRNTLDTLELASTETERVYEKKVDDLLEERRLLMAQGEDVESVAHQLRQLEEVVQELEEGLEDARRGEAEARGEVEFLRGEVERVRAELRREKEKGHSTSNGMLPEPPHMLSAQPVEPVLTNDADKWCALCERDGHDSISCPYEKS